MRSSGKSSNLKLAFVLLAAGEGSRMGSIPKALLLRDEKTLLEVFCRAVESFDPVEFLIVTGFHAQAIEAEVERLNRTLPVDITIKRNINARDGQGTSVRLALESLQSQFDALFVCLSDQPSVGVPEFDGLLKQFIHRTPREQIVMPMVKGQRGNPVLFSRQAVETILSSPGMTCRSYMDQHPELLKIYETDNIAYIQDVDTAEDILKFGLRKIFLN